MAYATVTDLEERWRWLTDEERKHADVLLQDAAAMLEPYANASEDMLKIVSINMVKRALEAQGDAFGFNQEAGDSASVWASSFPAGVITPPTRQEVVLLRGYAPRVGTAVMACE